MSKIEEAPLSSNNKEVYFLETLHFSTSYHSQTSKILSLSSQTSKLIWFWSGSCNRTKNCYVQVSKLIFSPKGNVKAPLGYRIGVDMIVTYENASLAVVALKNAYSVWLLHGTRRVWSVRRVPSAYRRRWAPLVVYLSETTSRFASLGPDISPHREWLLRGMSR